MASSSPSWLEDAFLLTAFIDDIVCPCVDRLVGIDVEVRVGRRLRTMACVATTTSMRERQGSNRITNRMRRTMT